MRPGRHQLARSICTEVMNVSLRTPSKHGLSLLPLLVESPARVVKLEHFLLG